MEFDCKIGKKDVAGCWRGVSFPNLRETSEGV